LRSCHSHPSALFPYTTLFRSNTNGNGGQVTDLGSICVGYGTIGIGSQRHDTRGLLGGFTGQLSWEFFCSFPFPSIASGAAEVIGEVFGGARLIRAVHHGDVGGWQISIWVLLCNFFVVPGSDFAGENFSDGLWVHVQGVYTLKIERNGNW